MSTISPHKCIVMLAAALWTAPGVAAQNVARDLRVDGHVVGPLGERIAGARVRLRDAVSGAQLAAQSARESGAFAFRGLPRDGAFVVEASAPGHCTMRTPLIDDSNSTRLRVTLWHAAPLRGRVRDERGRAVAGAFVRAHKWLGASPHERLDSSATTDARGSFEIDAVAVGKLWIAIAADGFALHESRVAHHGAASQRFELRSGREPELRLSVCDPDGRPARAAEIRIRVRRRRNGALLPANLARGDADAQGRCAIRAPARYAYLIHARKDGFRDSAEVKISPGDPQRSRELRLRALPENAPRGRVVDTTQKPCAGIRVRVRDADGALLLATKTDATGRYGLPRPSPRGPTPRAFLPDSSWIHFSLTPRDGAREHTCVVPEIRGSIAGRVLANDGSPAVGKLVRLRHDDGANGIVLPRVRTDRRGRFSLRVTSVFPNLHVQVDDREQRARSARLACAEKGFAHRITLRCQPAAVLRGRVVDALGDPIAGASLELHARAERGRGRRRFVTRIHCARDGRFVCRGLDAGAYEICESEKLWLERRTRHGPERRQRRWLEKLSLQAGERRELRIVLR